MAEGIINATTAVVAVNAAIIYVIGTSLPVFDTLPTGCTSVHMHKRGSMHIVFRYELSYS
jgi:hypothetical protein